MNIGFVEALKLRVWDCFIFHDVDLLPENDRNLYTCPTFPRHMSVAVDSMAYRSVSHLPCAVYDNWQRKSVKKRWYVHLQLIAILDRSFDCPTCPSAAVPNHRTGDLTTPATTVNTYEKSQVNAYNVEHIAGLFDSYYHQRICRTVIFQLCPCISLWSCNAGV